MGRHRRKEKLSGCACPFFQREIIMGRDVRFLCRCGEKETAHHAPAYRCRKEKGSSDGLPLLSAVSGIETRHPGLLFHPGLRFHRRCFKMTESEILRGQ